MNILLEDIDEQDRISYIQKCAKEVEEFYLDYDKITDEKIRSKLTEIIKGINAKGGFILRTAAEFAREEDIVSEANYLVGLYNEALEKYATASPGEVVYSEGNLAVRMLRDVYTSEIENIYVADKKLYEDILVDASRRGKEVLNKVSLYSKGIDIWKNLRFLKSGQKNGGVDRSRTDLCDFADRCLTVWLPRLVMSYKITLFRYFVNPFFEFF